MRHSLLHTAGNVVWAARNERCHALPLLTTYARLKLGELTASGSTATEVRRTTVLGRTVSFFDWYWLIEMYEEIFLRSQYRFEAVSSTPLVIDVGSNIGLSILYFKGLFPEARIVGFEPDPEAFSVLSENVRENGLQDVELVNEAVYDGAESVVLHGDPATPGSPQASTREGRLSGVEKVVSATRLSERITERVDYLKLDVEGAECVVISELEKSGKLELVDRMSIEYHHHVRAGEDRLSELLSTLERSDFGYELYARLSVGAPVGQFQNVMVHAYRKSACAPTAGC